MRGIDGFFTEDEGRWYARFARSLSGGTFVEIGSWKGRSTSFVGPICNGNGTRLVCVDHWNGSEDTLADHYARTLDHEDVAATFLANMDRLGIRVDVLRERSTVAAGSFADRSVDRLFLDGSHDGPSVRDDLAAWWPKISEGGIFAGHDYDEKHPDLVREVDVFAERHGHVVKRGPRSIFWLSPR
ncbi:MAG: class I SAM-dependent methyltransferase [Polyangiaceae bacterium]